MSSDVEILSSMWEVVKEYLPAKERQAVADHVVNAIADVGISESDLKAFGGTDSYLRRAVLDFLGEDDDEAIDDDEEDSW